MYDNAEAEHPIAQWRDLGYRAPAAGDIARSTKGKFAAKVRPVQDALADLGMACRLNDGRYA